MDRRSFVLFGSAIGTGLIVDAFGKPIVSKKYSFDHMFGRLMEHHKDRVSKVLTEEWETIAREQVETKKIKLQQYEARQKYLVKIRKKAQKEQAKKLAKKARKTRQVSIYNHHTGERAKVTYWADGKYQKDELKVANRILRDHRTGTVKTIDPRLFDQLYAIRRKLRTHKSFTIVSGYRSPKTNRMLRRRGRGVAKRSLHMSGRALDIKLPGKSIRSVSKAALAQKSGGVGTYRSFVHIDTGRRRRW